MQHGDTRCVPGSGRVLHGNSKYEQVRDIIKMVYTHQYEDDGNWPQWFMFDKYFAIQQEESHGDIIVWPLKVLADYLTATRDYAILDEKVPYTVKHSFGFYGRDSNGAGSCEKEIEYIRAHFLHDTFLSSYGDGDWDDTLQPANAQLKQYMVSSWTVALTYQSMNVLSNAMKSKDEAFANELAALAQGIREDFTRYMLGRCDPRLCVHGRGSEREADAAPDGHGDRHSIPLAANDTQHDR